MTSAAWNFIPGEYISVKTRWPLMRVCAFMKQNDKASKMRSLCFIFLCNWWSVMTKTPEICLFLIRKKMFLMKVLFNTDVAWFIHLTNGLWEYTLALWSSKLNRDTIYSYRDSYRLIADRKYSGISKGSVERKWTISHLWSAECPDYYIKAMTSVQTVMAAPGRRDDLKVWLSHTDHEP